jgi:hypothetical protein
MRRYKPAAQRHLQQPFSYWHISLCPHCSLLFIDIALVLSKDDLMSRSSSFSGRVNFTVKMEAPLRSVEARQESFPAVIASGVCITRLFNRRRLPRSHLRSREIIALHPPALCDPPSASHESADVSVTSTSKRRSKAWHPLLPHPTTSMDLRGVGHCLLP